MRIKNLWHVQLIGHVFPKNASSNPICSNTPRDAVVHRQHIARKLLSSVFLFLFYFFFTQDANSQNLPQSNNTPTAVEILRKIDDNIKIDKGISETTMKVTNRRGKVRISRMKSYVLGHDNYLVEYLYPVRQKGVKMLKLKDKLWIYTPEPTDRIVTISGHMLKQSVNGSDLSYEDMMENRSLDEMYDAKVTGSEIYNERSCWIVELTAKVPDVSYYSMKMWVDAERWIPLKEERYAKSGKLLKRIEIPEVFQVEGRWFPKKMYFKDMLSKGHGTEYEVESLQFDVDFPEHIFTKASLRK